jgi:hypothetical protein
MLANGGAARAAILAVLSDVNLFAARKCRHTKASNRVIPQELTILSFGANERVNRSFRDPSPCHLRPL